MKYVVVLCGTLTWPCAAKPCKTVMLEGMRGGVCAGRLDNLLLHSLPEPHFLAIPNGVLDFRGPKMNLPTSSSGTLFLALPNGVLDFPDPQMYPSAAHSKANGHSKPLQTHFGYARGMRGPREWRTPQSGSRQAVWKSMLVQNGYARGYTHYILTRRSDGS